MVLYYPYKLALLEDTAVFNPSILPCIPAVQNNEGVSYAFVMYLLLYNYMVTKALTVLLVPYSQSAVNLGVVKV